MSTFSFGGGLGRTSFFFSLGVALILSDSPPALAQMKHPAEEKGIASQKNVIETSISFYNRSQQTIKIYWLNLEGKRELRHVLKTGEQNTQTTFLTHPWLLTDEKDNALGLYYPDAEKRLVTYGTAFGGPKGGFGGGGGAPGGGNDLTAFFQIQSEASFGRYMSEIAHLARNPDVQAELKMTPEQIQKAAAAEIGLSSTPLRFPISSTLESATKTYDAHSTATEKALTDLLTAEQRKRFRQIMLQIVDSPNAKPSPGMRPSSASYPGVAEAIKLTPEQKAKLIKGTKAEDVLTADQKTAIKGMLGEPYKGLTTPTGKAPQAGGGPGIQRDPSNPAARFRASREAAFGKYIFDLDYIVYNTDVQSELKMTPEQIQKARSKGIGGAGGYVQIEKAIADILNADQKMRLRQIMIQVYEAPSSSSNLNTHRGAVTYPGVAEAIKLTPEQKARILEIPEIPPGRGGPRSADILTAEQQTVIKNMYGDPYKGRIGTRGFSAYSGRSIDYTGYYQTVAEARFGKYSYEFAHLARNPDVQAELKMTPEQIQKGLTADIEISSKSLSFRLSTTSIPTLESAAKQYDARSAATEKALGDLLTADQQNRFRQIMLQIAENTVLNEGMRPGPAWYPGVADAIKLTPEQKAKLIKGARPADVLSNEQKTAIQTMFGEPYKGRTIAPGTVAPIGSGAPKGGGGSVTGFTSPKLIYLHEVAVQSELKMSGEQIVKVKALAARQLEANKTNFSGLPPERLQKARELSKEMEDGVSALLTATQNKRLDQVARQHRGVNLLTDKTLVGALKLTPDQQEKWTTVQAQYASDRRAATVKNPAGTEAYGKQFVDIRAATINAAAALLIAEQKVVWQDYFGEPFPHYMPSLPQWLAGGTP